ncbi:hypothetical protein [Thermocoleostomius sinensis]|jgi:hypothetical protein|uniref:Uncharacterized protein n=1 Tax=Thermocoleostomius sinensis A174 TaxID=2016057 RepID=A0A9E8ZB99_9CYAN|nr:hypothetical protein [Thermocoleostomius sinensis]WAL60070.1 hypothetical protein OXH18_23335 [Thermocoleostomius sinensis A174]
MAIQVDPNEIIKLIKFIAAPGHGFDKPTDYRFELDPSFKGLNLRVVLIVTHLPSGDKTTIVLDP